MLIPRVVVLEEALEAGQLADEAAFLGPPFSVNVELAEEDDGSGLDVRTGAFCVDFSDEVLAMAREFDPVPDLETIVTFEASRPEALPMASDVLEHALKWAEEASGRTNFYSAREEPNGPPERPQGQPKKAAAKRVSNANVAEQVSLLASQVSAMLQVQQDMDQVLSAKAAPGPKHGGALATPAMPSLSESLSPPKGGLGGAAGSRSHWPIPKDKAESFRIGHFWTGSSRSQRKRAQFWTS